MPKRIGFDADYFDRYYESEASRVYGPAELARLAQGLLGMIRWFGGEVGSVLDVGAGAGFLRDWFRHNEPSVRYVAVDASPYACRRYGHEQRDIATWRAKERFDLVVCQGVLPYLDDAAASAALDNLATMSRGFLYLEAITTRDLREVCDRDKTDAAVHPRPGAFYRKALSRHFVQVGCGLFYAKSGPLAFYELECAEPPGPSAVARKEGAVAS